MYSVGFECVDCLLGGNNSIWSGSKMKIQLIITEHIFD